MKIILLISRKMQFNLYKKDYLKLIAISIFSILIDQLFLLNIDSPPAWDQGYHLSNLFKTYNILYVHLQKLFVFCSF